MIFLFWLVDLMAVVDRLTLFVMWQVQGICFAPAVQSNCFLSQHGGFTSQKLKKLPV
jgi:hypothetical protein